MSNGSGNERKTTSPLYADFRKFCISWGRLTIIIAMVMSFFPGLYLWLFKGVFPGGGMILQAFFPMILSWVLLWAIEPISYFPILGLAGTFVSWLSGNILNLRIPCSVIAQQAAGVEEGTEEGDIFSTLGLCASVIVNLVIVLIFAVAGVQILAVLPQSIRTGFNYILPAITGAMMINFIFRNWKVGVVGILLAVGFKLLGVHMAVEIGVVIFGTIIVSIFLYKKGIIK